MKSCIGSYLFFANIQGAIITEVKINYRARQFGSIKYGIDRTFGVLMDFLTVCTMNRFFNYTYICFCFCGILAIIVSFITSFYLLTINLLGADVR